MSTELLDCTLRDGTYVNDGNFGFETIKALISGLNNSNVDIIECGWLINKDFSINKTYFSNISDIEIFLECEKLGSLASSGKDHFHNWKEQSCLSVRMDTSPSENLNFSAQLSIQERTRQAMCSVPASKWYNGIAS